MNLIQLDSTDDIASICDRLDWAEEGRVVLVWPESGDLVLDSIDLVRMRRHADRQRIELGLIVTDKETARQARALGLPTFRDGRQARHSQRGWWRGRRRQERVGVPTVGVADMGRWRQEMVGQPENGRSRWQQLTKPVSMRQWGLRYAMILLFFLAMAVVYIGFVYALPRATLILYPQQRIVQATQTITADPALNQADFASRSVPARVLSVAQTWQAEAETTGLLQVPTTPAQGRVIFTNLTDESLFIPAGFILRTADDSNQTFQTLFDITLEAVLSSTVEVAVAALEPGPQANVAADTVSQLAGPWVGQVSVRNPEPMSGGAVREVAAVTDSDLTRLRSQVLQFLQAIALAEMGADVTEREFLARESLRVVLIEQEQFSHSVGDQTDRISLEMVATLQATAVNTVEAAGLAYDALAKEIPAQFTLLPDSLSFERGSVIAVDESGRVTLTVLVQGMATANLVLDEALTAVAGQDVNIALAYLYKQLPLRAVPEVEVWPLWSKRMPYWLQRIQVREQ